LSAPDPFEGASFTRQPQPAGPEEYGTAADEVETRLAELPGLVAVYRIGTVVHPGISDLDHIAVVDGHAAAPEVWSRLSERTRYLTMHGPFLADVPTFRRHRWFSNAEPLMLARGEPIDVEERPIPEYSERLLAVEGLVDITLRLLKQCAVGTVKVRPALGELHAVRLDLRLARTGESEAPLAWRLANDVAELRRQWFDPSRGGDRLELLAACLRRVPAALWEALDAAAAGVETAPADPADRLPLRGPWSSVTLRAGTGAHSAIPFPSAGRLRPLTARSARLAEARWRLGRRFVTVPDEALRLLAGVREDVVDFRAQRDALVRDYRRFLSRCGTGYSALGFAASFLGQ
jgi:hypothetical protein